MRRKLFTLAALLFAAALPALAHHSFTAEYDLRKPVTLRGAVVKFEMANPHGWIILDVKGGDGQMVRWMIQLSNPDILERAGWKRDSLKTGDETTVEAFQAKNDSHTASANLVLLPDGRKVWGGAPVAPPYEQLPPK